MFSLTNKTPHLPVAGFGLIELMVSVGIVTMVMGVVVAKQSSYNGAVLLRAEAYDIALQTRETQLMAVSATGESGNYRNVFGLYFNIETPNSYYSFKDTDGDFYFDIEDDIIIGLHGIDKRFEIDSIKTVTGTVESSINSLAIIFERPNFDAKLYTDGGPVSSAVSSINIDIRVKGTDGMGVGDTRTVEVSRTGQILVQPIEPDQRSDDQEPDGPGGGVGANHQ